MLSPLEHPNVGKHSYIFTADTNLEQLFQWRDDPRTQRNLAAEQPEILAHYRTRLRAWEAGHEASLQRVLR